MTNDFKTDKFFTISGNEFGLDIPEEITILSFDDAWEECDRLIEEDGAFGAKMYAILEDKMIEVRTVYSSRTVRAE